MMFESLSVILRKLSTIYKQNIVLVTINLSDAVSVSVKPKHHNCYDRDKAEKISLKMEHDIRRGLYFERCVISWIHFKILLLPECSAGTQDQARSASIEEANIELRRRSAAHPEKIFRNEIT